MSLVINEAVSSSEWESYLRDRILLYATTFRQRCLLKTTFFIESCVHSLFYIEESPKIQRGLSK